MKIIVYRLNQQPVFTFKSRNLLSRFTNQDLRYASHQSIKFLFLLTLANKCFSLCLHLLLCLRGSVGMYCKRRRKRMPDGSTLWNFMAMGAGRIFHGNFIT